MKPMYDSSVTLAAWVNSGLCHYVLSFKSSPPLILVTLSRVVDEPTYLQNSGAFINETENTRRLKRESANDVVESHRSIWSSQVIPGIPA